MQKLYTDKKRKFTEKQGQKLNITDWRMIAVVTDWVHAKIIGLKGEERKN